MPDAQGAGRYGTLRGLGASLAALVRVRLELIAVELREESGRRKEMLVLAAVAGYFLAAGLLLVGFLVIVVFWDTYRLSAMIGVTVAYLGVGAWAWLRLQERVRNSPPPFAATLAEFERDLEMLKARDE